MVIFKKIGLPCEYLKLHLMSSFFQSHTGFVYDVKACFAFMKLPIKMRYTKFLLFKCCMTWKLSAG